MKQYLYAVVSFDAYDSPVAYFNSTVDAKWYGDATLGEKNYGVIKLSHYDTLLDVTVAALKLLNGVIKWVPKGQKPSQQDLIDFAASFKIEDGIIKKA